MEYSQLPCSCPLVAACKVVPTLQAENLVSVISFSCFALLLLS